jgi:protein TonB
VLGGIIGGLPQAAPPPPPPPPPKPATPKSIRVGGNVQQANLIRQVKPVYPPLAKAARVQGTVKFEAVIAKDGTIQNLHVVSGPPLLVNAALEAVKQWQYKPTLLNGEPVEVITTIDVNFTLSQ